MIQEIQNNLKKSEEPNSFIDEIQIQSYLNIKHNEYSCYVMPVNDETNHWVVQIRELHKARLSNAGYRGYNDEVDNEYHLVGRYFFVAKNNTVVLTSRMNQRTGSSRFPFEMGLKDNGGEYVFSEEIVAVDINTYSLVPRHRKKAMPILLASLGKYADEIGAQKAFCLVDLRNSVVQRIYHDAKFTYSKSYSEPIAFPTFIADSDNKPVRWKIMEWGFPAIKYYRKLYEEIVDK